MPEGEKYEEHERNTVCPKTKERKKGESLPEEQPCSFRMETSPSPTRATWKGNRHVSQVVIISSKAGIPSLAASPVAAGSSLKTE